MGFGEAALELSRHYRIEASSVAEFRQRQPESYKLILPFTIEPMSEETRIFVDRAKAIADRPEVCVPAQTPIT